MIETKTQIENYLKGYLADDLKLLYDLASRIILGNTDFDIVLTAETEDVGPIIEEMTGRKIPFSYDTIISEEDLKTVAEFARLEMEKKILKKTRVDLLARLFSSDTLFEGFCLAFYGTDEQLEILCRDYGCPGRYDALKTDPVYQKRREYMNLISQYAVAAVNLYGVLHIVEFIDIVQELEKSFQRYDGYTRAEGAYRNTLTFSPEWFCLYTVQHLVGNCIPDIFSTLDGMMIHACFGDEVKAENEKMLDYFKALGHETNENDLSSFFDSVGDDSYFRYLFDVAGEKDMYVPNRREFLKYADSSYHEESIAEKNMRRYIQRKYLHNFAEAAKKVGVTTEQCIDDFMEEIYNHASDIGAVEKKDLHEAIEFIFASMKGYGISFDNINAANEFLGYAMKYMNSVRRWANHGYSPEEIAKIMPAYPGKMTVVPGSSHAAKLMSESKTELERMGINVDIDGSATEIPTFSFESGIKGGMKAETKKIYPNDPCPCGSGKKYKKCCGRNR